MVHVPVGVPPCQVDDFPSEVKEGTGTRPFKRSCKGALHLRPASTKMLTDDEVKHIKTAKQHKKLGSRLSVVMVTRKPPGKPPPKQQPLPPAPPMKADAGKKDGKK